MQTKTDNELLKAYVRDADESAYAELVARHGKMVFSVCYRLLADVGEAEDAAQATLMILARDWRSIRSDRDLSSWLHGVARRVSLTALRKKMRRQEIERGLVSERDGAMFGSDQESEQIRLAVLGQVDHVLSTLPHGQRQAVVLRYLEGRDQKTAAALAGCPLGTLKRRASKGIENMRRRLSRRGVPVTVTFLLATLAAESRAELYETWVSTILAESASIAAGAATGTAQTSAASILAEGVMKMMMWSKIGKLTAVSVFSVMMAGVGVLTRGGDSQTTADGDVAAVVQSIDDVSSWLNHVAAFVPATQDVDMLMSRFEAFVATLTGEYTQTPYFTEGTVLTPNTLLKAVRSLDSRMLMLVNGWDKIDAPIYEGRVNFDIVSTALAAMENSVNPTFEPGTVLNVATMEQVGEELALLTSRVSVLRAAFELPWMDGRYSPTGAYQAVLDLRARATAAAKMRSGEATGYTFIEAEKALDSVYGWLHGVRARELIANENDVMARTDELLGTLTTAYAPRGYFSLNTLRTPTIFMEGAKMLDNQVLAIAHAWNNVNVSYEGRVSDRIIMNILDSLEAGLLVNSIETGYTVNGWNGVCDLLDSMQARTAMMQSACELPWSEDEAFRFSFNLMIEVLTDLRQRGVDAIALD